MAHQNRSKKLKELRKAVGTKQVNEEECKENKRKNRKKEIINRFFKTPFSNKKLKKVNLLIEMFNNEIHEGIILEIDKKFNLTLKKGNTLKIINSKLIKEIKSV